MDRICPFLAADAGGRTVVDGFDPTHRCRAVHPSEPVERGQQLSTCLTAAHASCPRYSAAMAARQAGGPVTLAPDAVILQTRLVLDAHQPLRLVSGRSLGPRGRRWAIGATAAVGLGVVASGLAGGFGLVGTEPQAAGSSQPASSSGGPSAAPPAIGGITSSPPAASPSTNPRPTAPPTATQGPSPTPRPSTPSPRPQTYVVQPGDTLNAIALQFGTTVAALQEANGLGSSTVILVGQELIIP